MLAFFKFSLQKTPVAERLAGQSVGRKGKTKMRSSRSGILKKSYKYKNMITISPAFKLSSKPDSVKGAMLDTPTKVSHIVLNVSWNLEQIKDKFILEVSYSNKENNNLNIRYSKFEFSQPMQILFLNRKAGDENSDFICNHIWFSFIFPTNLPQGEFSEIKIMFDKFEDDAERESYLCRSEESGLTSDDFPTYKDCLL